MKTFLKYGLLIVLCGFLSFAILWANVEAAKEVCKGVSVEILNEDSTKFLTKAGILKELTKAGIDPVGKPIKSINTLQIEKVLKKYDYLENAECVIENGSRLGIRVKQLIPVMRVFTSHGSYYVNKDGKGIHADARYHVDVPIVIGDFDNNQNKITNVIPLAMYVKSYDALSQYVTAIQYKDASNIYIIPNIKGHIVNLGNATNLESKFLKLEKFYKEVIPVKGWWTYDTISVKWDYQIVATKRHKVIQQSVEYIDEDLDADADAIDLSPIVKADNSNSASTSSNNEVQKSNSNIVKPKQEEKPKQATSPKKETPKKDSTQKSMSTKKTSTEKPASSSPKKKADSSAQSKVQKAFSKDSKDKKKN